MNSRWTFRQTAPQNTTMRPHVAEKRQSGTRVFPLSAHNEQAAFEIPYGSIERPTTRKTPAEQAEFEVPALRWADISDATHGFSLLNDCKYGIRCQGECPPLVVVALPGMARSPRRRRLVVARVPRKVHFAPPAGSEAVATLITRQFRFISKARRIPTDTLHCVKKVLDACVRQGSVVRGGADEGSVVEFSPDRCAEASGAFDGS